MKTINTITRKATLITGIVMGALILSTTFANASEVNKKEAKAKKASQTETVTQEVLNQIELEDNIMAEFKALNLPTVKIFDANDNIVFEGKVKNINDIKEEKVVAKLLNCDFIMSLENTAYYRLQ